MVETFVVGHFRSYYSWIGPPVEAHGKSIPQKPTTTPRLRTEAIGKKNPDPLDIYFLWSISDLFFNVIFQMTSEQKYTSKNGILFVKRSCAEVSGLSEVLRFVGELTF